MKLQKETIVGERPRHGRWYDDACGTAFALELIGERWSLLIVRELLFGGRRFTDLRAGLPGISAKVLAERLEGLEAAGIVRRRRLAPPTPAQLYELTPWGYGAEEGIQALGRWAAGSPAHDRTLPLSPASFMVSLRTMVDRERAARAPDVTGAILIGADRFVARVRDGAFGAERGDAGQADFALSAPTAPPLAAVIYAKQDPAALAGEGLVASGDRHALTLFAELFDLPQAR